MASLYAGADVRTSLRDLRAEASKTDPVLLLATFTAYGLMHSPEEDPEVSSPDPILPHHVELLQAVTLMRNRWEVPAEAHDPEGRANGISEVLRQRVNVPSPNGELGTLLRQAAAAPVFERLQRLESAPTEEERRRLFAQEGMRLHTQAVRNWAYPQQFLRILTDLFAPMDDDVERALGVRVGALVGMFVALENEIVRRVNAHNDSVRTMLRAEGGVAEVFAAYEGAMPGRASTNPEAIRDLEARGIDAMSAKASLFAHSQLLLPDAFTFTLEEAVRVYPSAAEQEALRRVLDELSLEFGDLADPKTGHPFLADEGHLHLSNPVWTRPLIRLEEDRYFFPLVTALYAFGLQWMENLIAGNAGLVDRYERRRAEYLEQEVERLVRAAFPESTVFAGSLWDGVTPGTTYENDVLAVVDTFALIVEAKSARVNDAARRGGPASLRTKLRELIEEPAEQSERFAEYLKARPGRHSFRAKRGEVNEVDTGDVRHFVRLSVTLEDLGRLSARSPELQQAGLIPPGKALPPTIAVAELEMVFEVLEGTCQRLHYLARRAEFEQHAVYLGDECDLLAYYLDTGFNIGEGEFSGEPLLLWMRSKALDPYFMRRFTGIEAPKPTPRLTPWWRALLDRAEARRLSRWTEMGHLLLCASYEEQVRFEEQFRRMSGIVAKRGMDSDEAGVTRLVLGPPGHRRGAVVGLPYCRLSREERNRLTQEVGEFVLQQSGVDRCVVIGIDVELGEFPYDVLACVFADAAAAHLS